MAYMTRNKPIFKSLLFESGITRDDAIKNNLSFDEIEQFK